MNILKISAPGILLAAAVVANATTFATFHDPSANISTPLFVRDLSTNTLTGGWTTPGLTLLAPSLLSNTAYNNATFTMSTLALTPIISGVYSAGPGTVTFSDSSSNPLFTITFDGGVLTGSGVGASVFSGNNVTFTGPALVNPVTDAEFSFSFANSVKVGNLVKSTASFTSSATPVPEPATMAVLGLGVIGLLRRRQR